MKYVFAIRFALSAVLMAGLTLSPLTLSGASDARATSPVVNVWTEPVSGYGFLDAAIQSAHHSIEVSVYELSDATIERELIARAAEGIDVRVLLDADYHGTSENANAFALMHASRVHVEWAPAGQIFHAKYVVVDTRVVYIGTGNLVTNDYSSTRDFWVEDTRSSDLSAIVRTFNSDFAHVSVTYQAGGLVWSPGSTSTLIGLIDSAKHSLLVENEEMDSAKVESALESTARRGVSVKVIMTESSSGTAALNALARAGVHVRVLRSSQVYIHAKVICVDCERGVGTVFIGSENFSTSSLSYNRELGLITTTPKAVLAVGNAVNSDYGDGTTVSPVVPIASPGAGSSFTVTSFESSVSPGAEDSLSVHAKANIACDLTVTLPSGYLSESHGLGVARTNTGGNVTWTWEIGPSTDPGTAHAAITCGTRRVDRTFQIR